MSEFPGNSPLFAARAARAGDESVVQRALGSPGPEIDYAKKRFLVIDAVQEMRSAMNATLSTFGAVRVEYANRATEAIGMMKRGDYDIILCDFDLGRGYDGLHLLEELKHRNLLRPSAIFMIVTGERRARMVISAAEMAPDDYLLKPFTGEELRTRLDRIYRKKSAFQVLDAAMMGENYFKALAECNECIQRRDPYTLDFLRMRGKIALMIGDYRLAQETYDLVLQARDTPWARIGLAKAKFHLKDYAGARQLLEGILAENRHVMEAYDWLAKIHQAEHEYDRAQQVLTEATVLSPAIVQRQRKLGEVAMKNGDFETAVKAYRQTVTLAKHSFWRDAVDYARLSRAQVEAGALIEATKTAAEVRREFRYDKSAEVLACVMECQVAAAQGSRKRAEELLEKAKQAYQEAGTNLPDHFAVELAEACYRMGDDESAGKIVQTVLKNHHEDPSMLERVSDMFDAVGKTELGRQMIEDNAQTIVAINNEAVRMAQAGDLEGAVEKFIEAVNEMPANVQIMLNAVNAMLACVARLGWNERYILLADEYLERVKALEPAASVKYLKLKDAYTTARRRFRA
jgi:DNA-binding response OmpR family regulator/lipopolysaccharide biosynthesis regulator YciM